MDRVQGNSTYFEKFKENMIEVGGHIDEFNDAIYICWSKKNERRCQAAERLKIVTLHKIKTHHLPGKSSTLVNPRSNDRRVTWHHHKRP